MAIPPKQNSVPSNAQKARHPGQPATTVEKTLSDKNKTGFLFRRPPQAKKGRSGLAIEAGPALFSRPHLQCGSVRDFLEHVRLTLEQIASHIPYFRKPELSLWLFFGVEKIQPLY
jgi:hypothetical protein